MATISIADNDARIQHQIGSGGNTANSTTFTIDFPFFALDDINVIITNSSGVDTTLSRGSGTNTFAVAGTAVDDGFSGGNVTLGSVYTSSTVTIFRDIPVTRTTDFATSGPFNIASLNTELDRIIAIEQELETQLSRTIRITDSEASLPLSLVLPKAVDRVGKFLSFDTSGAPIVTTNAGNYKGAWAAGVLYSNGDTVTDTTDNNVYIISSPHTSSGVLPLTTNVNSAFYTLFINVSTIQTTLVEETATQLAIVLG